VNSSQNDSSTSNNGIVISIDCGTTGIRSFAVSAEGRPLGYQYREFTQHFPQPGWVEHDASEIWDGVQATLADLLATLPEGVAVRAIGITNQRETVVAWDRNTGKPLARAIVWQDRRTAGVCDRLEAEGHLPTVRARTGLVLDPYFSGTKFRWLLDNGVAHSPSLLMGTIDDWVLWNLTGGPTGGVHATDPSNASRTMLYDITSRQWSSEMSDLLNVPLSVLPEVRPSSGRFGTVSAQIIGGQLAGVPISGILGDQQSALFGQACLSSGMCKNTYGTGSFMLMNVGRTCPAPSEGLLTTVAWDLGDHGGFAYGLEGAVFVTGAAIQWLRDGLGIINSAAEVGPLAASVADTDGVYVVPAFAGLGSPWWDPYARGTIVGITRGTGRAHIARAVVESIAFQVRDVVDRMTQVSGAALAELRVDGGAAVMDLLLQLQADQLGVPVSRPEVTETTAMGAAYAAGLAEGVWASTADVSNAWKEQARFLPQRAKAVADKDHARWLKAVDRSRAWAD
jgi:glycerol kinase